MNNLPRHKRPHPPSKNTDTDMIKSFRLFSIPRVSFQVEKSKIDPQKIPDLNPTSLHLENTFQPQITEIVSKIPGPIQESEEKPTPIRTYETKPIPESLVGMSPLQRHLDSMIAGKTKLKQRDTKDNEDNETNMHDIENGDELSQDSQSDQADIIVHKKKTPKNKAQLKNNETNQVDETEFPSFMTNTRYFYLNSDTDSEFGPPDLRYVPSKENPLNLLTNFETVSKQPLKGTSILIKSWTTSDFLPLGAANIEENPGHKDYLEATELIKINSSDSEKILSLLKASSEEDHPLARMNLLHFVMTRSNFPMIDSWMNKPDTNPNFMYHLTRGLSLGEFPTWYFLHRNSVLGDPSIVDQFNTHLFYSWFEPLQDAFHNDLLLTTYTSELALSPTLFNALGSKAFANLHKSDHIKQYPPAQTVLAISAIAHKGKNKVLGTLEAAAKNLILIATQDYPAALVEFVASPYNLLPGTQATLGQKFLNFDETQNILQPFANYIKYRADERKSPLYPGKTGDHYPKSLLWDGFAQGNLAAHAICAHSAASRFLRPYDHIPYTDAASYQEVYGKDDFFETEGYPAISLVSPEDLTFSLTLLSKLKNPEFEYYKALDTLLGIGRPQNIRRGMSLLFELAEFGFPLAAFRLGTLYLPYDFPIPSFSEKYHFKCLDGQESNSAAKGVNPDINLALQWFQRSLEMNPQSDWTIVAYQAVALAYSAEYNLKHPRTTVGMELADLAAKQDDIDGMFAKLILITNTKADHDINWVVFFFLYLKAHHSPLTKLDSTYMNHIYNYVDWIQNIKDTEYKSITGQARPSSKTKTGKPKSFPKKNIPKAEQDIYTLISTHFTGTKTQVPFYNATDLADLANVWQNDISKEIKIVEAQAQDSTVAKSKASSKGTTPKTKGKKSKNSPEPEPEHEPKGRDQGENAVEEKISKLKDNAQLLEEFLESHTFHFEQIGNETSK